MKPLDLGKMSIVCSDCDAKHWIGELPSNSSKSNMFWTSCCNKGAVKPPLLMDPPDFLKGLLQNTDQQSRQFRASIRQYNAAFAFTSMTFNGTNRNNDQSGWMPFQIHGELCHLQGPLTPEEGAMGVYSQIYYYDSDYEKLKTDRKLRH
jgi:hypothetical protein